ncbi:MAG: preprotein translocase subunit SecG [Actinobacteria bacterium]|nr:preprotein translocase subunit SecG [Actinomycetota bacterium]
MKALEIVLIVIHVIASLGLVVSVLLHSGKGGGLSSALGGGSSSMFSGSYVVEKNLDRLTIGAGAIFVVTTLLLTWLMS